MHDDAAVLEVSVEILKQMYSHSLDCDAGYTSCVQSAGWVSNGACPACGEQKLHKLFCIECKNMVESGGRLRHDSCGYHGPAYEFFKEFRQL